MKNNNTKNKKTKKNNRHPLTGGDDIKCQTVDQHQGEICKMRVLTAKRAPTALANMCVWVCVCVRVLAYICLCMYAHICRQPFM